MDSWMSSAEDAEKEQKNESLEELRTRPNKELFIRNNPLSLRPSSLNDLLKRKFPSTRWIVDGLVPSEGITILSAAPSSFKTWAMLEITLAVTDGRQLFGHYATSATGVLLVDEESGERILNERFKQLGASPNSGVQYFSREGYKVSAEYIDSLISVCLANNIGLVMFDSLVRMHQGDENTSRDMSELFNQLRRLADNGIAVLIAHHNRKGSAGGSYSPAGDMRGSSDILASVDCHMAFSRHNSGDYVTVHQTKNRYMREIAPFKLRFIDNGDTSEFLLMDVMQTKDEIRSQLRDSVLSSITENPGYTKQKLLDALVDSGLSIKNWLLGEIIEELIADEKVESKPGSRNAVHYYAANPGSALKA